VIETLKSSGTTIVLTTQYLEEADRLAERISVIDGGRIIAEGTADELKARIGGDVLTLALNDKRRTATTATLLAKMFDAHASDVRVDPAAGTITLPVDKGAQSLVDAVRALDAKRITLADISLHRPSLDDVFLTLTGHGTEDEADAPPTARRRRSRRATQGAA
jgi:ABC-2 type transport system ATP-binding protein